MRSTRKTINWQLFLRFFFNILFKTFHIFIYKITHLLVGGRFRCGMTIPHCFKQPLPDCWQLNLQQLFTEPVAGPGYLPFAYSTPVEACRSRQMEPGGFEPPCCSSFFSGSTISVLFSSFSWARTNDIRVNSSTLYLLSYEGSILPRGLEPTTSSR